MCLSDRSGWQNSRTFALFCLRSGALQHLARIGAASTVAAINSDSQAPIFHIADYDRVGDVQLVLLKRLDALQEFLKTK
jgi:electron transfer flavoprotein alpha subunit